jgi:hypothetical protein
MDESRKSAHRKSRQATGSHHIYGTDLIGDADYLLRAHAVGTACRASSSLAEFLGAVRGPWKLAQPGNGKWNITLAPYPPLSSSVSR